MCFILSGIEQYIEGKRRCHFVGIGGVSMSPLAEILHGAGVVVSGSDMGDSNAVSRLRKLGIPVTVGHRAENVHGAGFVIRTAAARDDNVEIAAARETDIPVFERAEAWGYIMRGYENAICVAGVHGKTTTTAMMTQILLAAGRDPTVMIGGTFSAIGGTGYRIGAGDTIVLESCEYYNSFHNFFPTVAIILNIDADHLDFFKDLDEVKSSFRKFAALTPESGYIVCNGDDENTMSALAPLGRGLFAFGLGDSPLLRVRGVNVSYCGRTPSMDVLYDGVPYCRIKLSVPGLHNLKDALAAAAAAITLGLPAKSIEDGLSAFVGAGRRFEFKGCLGGADVYDDYAHHPSELSALIDMVLSLDYDRIILAFQPHTYTRTRALFADFVKELRRVDIVLLAEIYAAREPNDMSVSSADIAAAVPGAMHFATLGEISDEIHKIARDGDIILTVGAGDIFRVGETLV